MKGKISQYFINFVLLIHKPPAKHISIQHQQVESKNLGFTWCYSLILVFVRNLATELLQPKLCTESVKSRKLSFETIQFTTRPKGLLNLKVRDVIIISSSDFLGIFSTVNKSYRFYHSMKYYLDLVISPCCVMLDFILHHVVH